MTAPQGERGNRQRLRGVVVRDKAHKTITVEVVRRFQHPRYGKMVRRHTRLAAHDPADEAHLGDTVEIMVCRPLSKTKRYRLLRIVERGPGEALVGQPPDRPEPRSAQTADAGTVGTGPAEPPAADTETAPVDDAEPADAPAGAPPAVDAEPAEETETAAEDPADAPEPPPAT